MDEPEELTFDDVEKLLDSDLENFDGELGMLYDRIERYVETAEAMDTAGREDDAEYFKELALGEYRNFSHVIQMNKVEEEEKEGYE